MGKCIDRTGQEFRRLTALKLNFPPKKPSISAESMEMAVAA